MTWLPLINKLRLYRRTIALVGVAFLLHILLSVWAYCVTRADFERRPCAVCGRSHTKPVATLWQYRAFPVAQMRDVRLWYCRRHISKAPEIVHSIPAVHDSVAHRLAIFLFISGLGWLALLVSLLIFRLPPAAVLLHSGVITLLLWLVGPTAGVSLTIVFMLLFVLPAIVFGLWQHVQKKQL